MTAEQANRAKLAKARALNNHDDNVARNIRHAQAKYGRGDDEGAEQPRARIPGAALGLFSIGLGLTELLAPRALSRMIGIKPSATASTTMRLYGLREIATGVGMLLQPDRPEWAWGRVAGDALDIATLARAAGSRRNNSGRILAMSVATAGIAALDVMHARELGRPRIKSNRSRTQGVHVQRSVTVNRPRPEVYDFWRDFENLPLFMKHLESVDVTGDNTSHWTAKAPGGSTVEWDAELIKETPNELIAWQSLESASVPNSGTVVFVDAPGGRGTEVHVDLRYDPPGGKFSALIAKLFGEEPGMQIADDMRRLKQVLETGEVLVSDASMHNGMHPAQPSDREVAYPPETERTLVVERAADAMQQSSNRDREDTNAREDRDFDDRDISDRDDRYNNELANERSTF